MDVVEGFGHETGKVAVYARQPAPPALPPQLTDAARVGQETVTAPPEVLRPPAEESRTPAIGYVLMAVPVVSCGFAAWVPALWAGLKREASDPARTRLLALSGALLGGAAAGFVLVAVALADAAGQSTGPLPGIGSILVIMTVIVGTVVAVRFRKPPAR